jgi:hypothetical protein
MSNRFLLMQIGLVSKKFFSYSVLIYEQFLLILLSFKIRYLTKFINTL